MLGLTGAGGSILAVPLLMAGMGWTLPQAAPVALLAVCAAATFGTIVAWDRAYVRFRAATLMGFVAAFTAPVGVMAAAVVPLPLLTVLFAIVLTLVAIRMLRQAVLTPAEAGIVRATVAGEGPTAPARGYWIPVNERGRIVWGPRTAASVGGIGAMTGFIAGLLGVGGGFVIVPALRMASGLSMHSAVATSLMAIALISAIAAAGAIAQGVPVDWAAAPGFVLGALAGMFAGRRVAPRIAGPRLQQGFATVMLVVAAVLGGHAGLLMYADWVG